MKLLLNILSPVRFFGMYLSIALVLIALTGTFSRGLNLGIDFTGGFITEYSTSESLKQSDMQKHLQSLIENKFVLTSAERGTNWTVRQPDIAADQIAGNNLTSKSWLKELQQLSFFEEQNIKVELLDSDYIGSQIGQELIDQGGLAMLTALIIILVYLSARFEWRFALGAVLALFHDVIVVIGIFAWTQLEFNLTVLASILAIIGYSLNDSIIVADRIRETMKLNKNNNLSSVINLAVLSTMTRTLITSGTTLATILSLWWLAGMPLQGFSVALFFGILVGTFSSVCISATFPEVVGLDVNFYKLKELEKKEILEGD